MIITNDKPRPAADYLMAQHLMRYIRQGRLVLMPQPDQMAANETAADRIRTAPVTKLTLDRKEAARQLSVSQRTFDRWVAMGLIRPSGVGRRKIFAISELQRFLKETSETIDL